MSEILSAFSTPAAWVQLLTLIFLEIILGIDNIVFIAITSDRLKPSQQHFGRRLGLIAALVMRVLLLLTLNWIIHLNTPMFYIGHFGVTGKGLILLFGGIYLIYKGIVEIKEMLSLEAERYEMGHPDAEYKPRISMTRAIVTIAAMDVVFSLDSVITAVGLSGVVPIMIAAITVAIIFMMLCADKTSDFINKNPQIKLLALFFILTIGVLLVVDFFEIKVPEAYVYFAMFFSLLITLLQMRYQRGLDKLRAEVQEAEKTLARTEKACAADDANASDDANAADAEKGSTLTD